jgi:hypothetical protein
MSKNGTRMKIEEDLVEGPRGSKHAKRGFTMRRAA